MKEKHYICTYAWLRTSTGQFNIESVIELHELSHVYVENLMLFTFTYLIKSVSYSTAHHLFLFVPACRLNKQITDRQAYLINNNNKILNNSVIIYSLGVWLGRLTNFPGIKPAWGHKKLTYFYGMANLSATWVPKY